MKRRLIKIIWGPFDDALHTVAFYNENKAIFYAEGVGDTLRSIEYSDGTKLEIVKDYLDGRYFGKHLEPIVKADYYRGDLRRFVKHLRSLGQRVETSGGTYTIYDNYSHNFIELKERTKAGVTRVYQRGDDWLGSYWRVVNWSDTHKKIVCGF